MLRSVRKDASRSMTPRTHPSRRRVPRLLRVRCARLRRDPRTPLSLRHDAERRRADPGRRLLARGQGADRAAARRARHRLYRGGVSRRQSDRHQAVRRAAETRLRRADRLRHDQAARPLDLERSGLPGGARSQGARDLPRRQDLGLSCRCGARHHARGKSARHQRLGRGGRGLGTRGAARLRAFLRRLQGESRLRTSLRQGGLRRRRPLGGALRYQWRHAARGDRERS